MGTPRSRPRLILSLCAATAAAAACAAYLAIGESDGDPPRVAAPPATVLVAKRDIPAGTILTAEMLEVRQLPLDARSPGALSDLAQAVGILTAAPLRAGEQVLDTRLTARAARGRTSALDVPPGQGVTWLAFRGLQASGVSGVAALWAEGDATHVSIRLAGEEVVGGHPTHIHAGTCDNFAPSPTAPLTTVILDEVGPQGRSDTTFDLPALAELRADAFVILVHQSADALATHLACGEINRDVVAMPNAGAGAPLGPSGETTALPQVLAALAALAALLAVRTVGLRRR